MPVLVSPSRLIVGSTQDGHSPVMYRLLIDSEAINSSVILSPDLAIEVLSLSEKMKRLVRDGGVLSKVTDVESVVELSSKFQEFSFPAGSVKLILKLMVSLSKNVCGNT